MWLIDLEGIVRIEGRELCFEFRARHAILHYIHSKSKEVRIPMDELEEVRFRRYLWRGELVIRAQRMTTFGSMSGRAGNELRLRCRREDWELARELASRLSMFTMEQELRTLISATEPSQPLTASPDAQRPESAGLESRKPKALPE